MDAVHPVGITGFDTVLFSSIDPVTAAYSITEKVTSRWLSVVTDIDTMKPHRSQHINVQLDRFREIIGSASHVVIYFFRDEQMRRHLESSGYTLDTQAEGAIAIHLRIRRGIIYRLGSVAENHNADPVVGTVRPYPAWLSSPSILETTVVTPADPGSDVFSSWTVEQVLLALSGGSI